MTLIRSFLLLMIISVCACSKKPGTPTAPNILLIMCDDLGWGDVGFNGNSFVKTPHLDYLAEAGMVLKRFYTASPVCSPTRASCLTGRNPYRQAIYTC